MVADFCAMALSYAESGFAVFPLAPHSKIPAIRGGSGVKEATKDSATIKAWWRRFPDANVGIACGEPSGIVVIDVDPRNGGSETITRLSMRGHVFPDCPTAVTGGGGRHLFVRFDPRIGNSKDKIGKGIDVKSTGGYVVAAPSFVPCTDGRGTGHYRWLRRPSETRIPRVPIWASTLLVPPPRPPQSKVPLMDGPRNIHGLIKFLTAAGSGERNNRLYWCSRRVAEMVRAHQVAEGGAVSQLLAASAAVGLPPKEAAATIRSAFIATYGGENA